MLNNRASLSIMDRNIHCTAPLVFHMGPSDLFETSAALVLGQAFQLIESCMPPPRACAPLLFVLTANTWQSCFVIGCLKTLIAW